MDKSDSHRMAQRADRSPNLPLPRDPEVAVREEFALAQSQGTAEAFELFISRHADHPLGQKARQELDRLRHQKR